MAGVGIEGAKQAYRDYLGREAYDTEGGFLNIYANKSADQLRNIFTNSDEYRSRQSAALANTGGAFSPPADNSDLSGFAATQRNEMQGMLDRQKREQDVLFEEYKKKMAGQETSTAAYTRLRQELGLPDLEGQLNVYKDQIYGVKDLIDRLEEDVNARTQGSFTNESQRRRQIAYEGEPLNNQLARLGTGMAPIAERLNSASGEVGTLLNLQSADQTKELRPYEMQISALSDRFSREMTGFTTSKQTELDALMDKIARGRALADREWELAQSLAAEERAWARTKEEIRLKASADSGTGNAWAAKMNEILGKYASTGGEVSNAPAASMSAATRAGAKSNDISFNGQTYTREGFAKKYSQMTGLDYNAVLQDVYKQFPDYTSTLGLTGYTSPTKFFGV